MKIKSTILIILTAIFLVSVVPVWAQGMMGGNLEATNNASSSTAQDEASGKLIFDKLQAKQVDCKNLTDDDFDVLGDYFMGLRLGGSHASMNARMTQMMGKNGEKQMHIVIGKRLSGCDTNASYPSWAGSFLSMMGQGGLIGNYYGGMMGGNFGFRNGLNVVICILAIIFLVSGIIYFWKEIVGHKKK